MRSLGRLGLALLLMALAFNVRAGQGCDATGDIDTRGSEFQFFVENDMFGGTDRYYTNGLKLGLGTQLDTAARLLGGTACDWLLQRASPIGGNLHFGLFLGQNMYTPRAIRIRDPQPFDRPWAAWLYLGGVAQRMEGDVLDTAELDVGMVGPAALGRQVQTNWHRLIGVQRPLGWDNQQPNEPAFVLTYLHKHRFGNDTFDIVPHAGLSLGTVTTLARAGGIVRIGHRLSGFGPDGIEPGGAMLQATRSDDVRPVENFEWYVFAGADARLVGRNVFLDGTVFHDSPSVDRRTHVHDLTRGFSVRYGGLRFSLTRVRRSEEFTTARGGGGPQLFDSLNLGYEF